ncbi:outer membrane beta-barrel protein [Thalassotalea crassostreae]|uniref:outer membrane beta-barrel protein n=2 Tax=Thalassotalea crassostreae TaxID=1763536 RepID=UPI0008397DAB|nr:outer membrane beta-barrel protein [Thalassotalea crassostreae]
MVMKLMTWLKCFLLLSVFVTADASALAEENEQDEPKAIVENTSNFYVGLMFIDGETEEQFENNIFQQEPEIVTKSDNNGYGLYAGFNFDHIWAIESSIYVISDLNERESSYPIKESYLTVITITPVLHFDVTERFSAFFKTGLGLMIFTERHKSHGIENHKGSDIWTGAGLLVGGGLELDIYENWVLRLGVEYVEASLSAEDDNHLTNRKDVDETLSAAYLSVHYNF